MKFSVKFIKTRTCFIVSTDEPANITMARIVSEMANNYPSALPTMFQGACKTAGYAITTGSDLLATDRVYYLKPNLRIVTLEDGHKIDETEFQNFVNHASRDLFGLEPALPWKKRIVQQGYCNYAPVLDEPRVLTNLYEAVTETLEFAEKIDDANRANEIEREHVEWMPRVRDNSLALFKAEVGIPHETQTELKEALVMVKRLLRHYST